MGKTAQDVRTGPKAPNAGSPSSAAPAPTTAPAAPKPAKPPINKRAKLHELAEKRVTRAIHDIRLCGNLAAYEPTDAEAAKIVEVLGQAVDEVGTRFAAKAKGASKETFRL